MTIRLRYKMIVAWPIVFTLLALVFENGNSGETDNLRIKRVYTDEDAPSEIRFRSLLNQLFLEIEGQKDRGPRILREIGFDEVDIPRIRSYLESVYAQSQVEIDEGHWRVACQGTASDLDGLEIRVVFNSFDDLRYAVAAKYLAIASAELASMGYPDFQYMITQYPGAGSSFKVISTDHRFAWGDSSDRIRQVRAKLCRNLGEKLGMYFE